MSLPDEIYQKIERLAQISSCEITDVIAHTIKIAFDTVNFSLDFQDSISLLSDQDVLKLTHLEMEIEEDQRLSNLLDEQQAGTIKELENVELSELMQIYQEGLLRKAIGIQEAVKRGLMEPLN